MIIDDFRIAFDVCLSALLSKEIYSFSEIVSHPILSCLIGKDFSWVRDLVINIDLAKSEFVEIFEEKYVPKLQSMRFFQNHINLIRTKLQISIVQRLIFELPFGLRILKFEDIQRECKISADHVELLLLRALSLNLLKGQINGLDSEVVIYYVKPRVITKNHLRIMKTKVDFWIQQIHDVRSDFQRRTNDVFD